MAHAHELHPEALRDAGAIVPLLRDLDLVPRARRGFARLYLADAAGETALVGLDQVADDLIRAPLVWFEVPGTVVAERGELRLDERGCRLEVAGDLLGREVSGRHG